MDFELYTETAVARNLPEAGLCRGDVVKLVERHKDPGGITGFSVEVLNAKGQAVRVEAVAVDALEPLPEHSVLCARPASV